jgi:uncharacterized membrane protein YfhO
MDIYELYDAKPYFEVINGAGELKMKDRFKAFLSSAVDSQVVRRELFYPGWKATIDGKGVPIECYKELFQTVRVSSGRHEIRFCYSPTYVYQIMGTLVVGVCWTAFSLGSRCLKRW